MSQPAGTGATPKARPAAKKGFEIGQNVKVSGQTMEGKITEIRGNTCTIVFPDGSEIDKSSMFLKPGRSPEQLAMNQRFDDTMAKLNSKEKTALSSSVNNLDTLTLNSKDLASMVGKLKESQKRDFVQAQIYSLYSKLDWKGPVAIATYTEEREGNGDIVNGLKVCKNIRDKFSHASTTDLPFIVDQKTFKKMGNIGEGYGIEPLALPYLTAPSENDKMPASHQHFDSLILAPTMMSFSAYQELRKINNITSEHSTVTFEECCKNMVPGAPAMGIRPGEIGIPVNRDLRAFNSDLSTHQTDEARREFRSKLMDNFEYPGLTNAIRSPRDLDSDGLKNAISEGTDVRSLESYNADSRLYFGYTNRSGSKFIQLAARLEANKGKNLDIIHAGKPYITQEDSRLGLNGLLEDIKKDGAGLGQLGYSKIEIIQFDEKTREAKTPQIFDLAKGPQNGPSIRVILPPRLSPQDMSIGWKAGEEFVACTGNQSTAEVISSGKQFFYETLNFPQNRQFAEEIFEVGEFGALGEANSALCNDILDPKATVNREAYDMYVEELQSPGMREKYNTLSETVANGSNFDEAIIGRVMQNVIIRNADDNGKELKALEETLLSSDYSAEKFDAFLGGLKTYINPNHQDTAGASNTSKNSPGSSSGNLNILGESTKQLIEYINSESGKHFKSEREALLEKYQKIDGFAQFTSRLIESSESKFELPSKLLTKMQTLLSEETASDPLVQEVNLQFINTLNSAIKENKLGAKNVFNELTTPLSSSERPNRKDIVSGFIFSAAHYAAYKPKYAYAVAELLKTIAGNDESFKSEMREKLLATDSYKQRWGKTKYYHDFYGELFKKGREEDMGRKVGGMVATNRLSASNLTPLPGEAQDISPKRDKKYTNATINANKAAETTKGKAILDSATVEDKTTQQIFEYFQKLVSANNPDQRLFAEHKKIDEQEKNYKINSEWKKHEAKVKSDIKAQWKEAMIELKKKLEPGILGLLIDPAKAGAYSQAAQSIKLEPDSKTLDELVSAAMKELKKSSEVSNFVRDEALKNHKHLTKPSDANEAKQNPQSLAQPLVSQKVAEKAATVAKQAEQAAHKKAEAIVTEKAQEAQRKTQAIAAEKTKEAQRKTQAIAAEKAKEATRRADAIAAQKIKEATKKADAIAAEKAKEAAAKAAKAAAEKAAQAAKEAAGRAIDAELQHRLNKLRDIDDASIQRRLDKLRGVDDESLQSRLNALRRKDKPQASAHKVAIALDNQGRGHAIS